jgi:hypothetical protein
MKKRRILAHAALLATLAGARLASAQPATPELLNPCAFAHDELATVLGLAIERSHVADMRIPGGRDVGCTYTVKKSETVLTVRQTWDPASSGPPAAPGEPQLRPIAGDADHAMHSTGPPDHPSAELVYWRGKVKTRLLVHGPTVDSKAMLEKLLKLRRVP